MSKSKVRLSLFIFSILILTLLFQNCQNSKLLISKSSSSLVEKESFDDEIEVDGEIIDTPTVHPPGAKPTEQNPIVHPLVGNRLYVFNLLKSVFGPSTQNFLAQQVAWAPNEFGMSMSLYNRNYLKDCAKSRDPLKRCDTGSVVFNAGMRKGFNTRRAGLRLRVCNYATMTPVSLLYAIKRIDQDSDLENLPEPTEQNLSNLFELFFRGKTIDKRVVTALSAVFSESEDPLEGWKFSIRAVCMSPHWQVL